MPVLATIGEVQAQQGTVRSYTFFEGEKQNLVYKGQREEIKALYDSFKTVAGYQPTYDSITYDPGKGMATLTLTTIEDGQPVYELMVNELSNPIESNPYFDSLTSDEVMKVLQYVDEKLPADGAWDPLQTELYQHMVHGVTEYSVSQYVLRETKNVSKRSTVTASFTDVNRKSDPPDTSAANTLIGAIPEQEWLKKSPVVRQIGGRRWQIVTEWWGAEKLSSILYGGSQTYT